MKALTLSPFALGTLCLALLPGLTSAQSGTSDSQTRDIGGSSNGGGASIVAPKTPPLQVEIVTYTAVSAPRQWTDVQGRKIVAQLLAFHAPAEGETGPVEVIREDKVRLLLSGAKQPSVIELAKLSPEDQELVRQIAKAAAQGPPKAPEKTPTAPK